MKLKLMPFCSPCHQHAQPLSYYWLSSVQILLRVWVGDTESEWRDSPSIQVLYNTHSYYYLYPAGNVHVLSQEEALSSQFMLSGESPSVSVSSPTALEATVTATGFNTSCRCVCLLLICA